ncbi:MAG: acyl-CoA thioesterase [Deltaproteobacteria bacterium]
MPSIKETRNQMIQFVFPEHANNLGTLHGGRLMDWIMLAASITSSRLAKGITVLGNADSIDFINPVRVGEILILDSWVEYVGTSSMEIGVRVRSENPETGELKHTTSSHLAFVAVDNDGKPREIKQKITPADPDERAIYHEAQRRKGERVARALNKKSSRLADALEAARFKLETIKPVLPEDAFYGSFLSVGKLMKDVDEVGAILAARVVRGSIVTGSVDDLWFYSPIKVGEVVIFMAGITYTGKASLEIGVKIFSENLTEGIRKHTSTAYLSFVHVGADGRPRFIKPFTPETPAEITLWQQAEERKRIRAERVYRIKQAADLFLAR